MDKISTRFLPMKWKWNYYATILALLTILAAGIRLYKLGDYPSGFGQDEAVVTYDAWSLLTTGCEHHGERWPLNMRQYGDYCPGATTYYTMPFVAVLGPTVLAARLVCALFNIAAVPFFGLLATRLFRSRSIGLFAAALLTVAPWNIFFSRWATNPCFVAFFEVTSLWMLHRLLTSSEGHRSYGMAVTVGVMLFLWTHEYLSEYLFVPFLVGVALLLWCRKNWGRIIVAGGVYSLLMLPVIVERLHSTGANGRLSIDSIFILKNPLVEFWYGYWDCLSFNFLFNAPPMRPLHQLPGMAHISHYLAPLYMLGLLTLAAAIIRPRMLLHLLGRPDTSEETSHWRHSAIWVAAWLGLAPIANALFLQRMYTARMPHLLVGVLLVIALGCAVVWYLLRRIPTPAGRAASVVFVAVLALYLGQQAVKTGHTLVMYRSYFRQYLQYGAPDVMRYLAGQPNVRSVRFSPLNQGYIYHLLFTPVLPSKVNYAEVAPPIPKEGQQWRYAHIDKVGNYFFNQSLNPAEVARTATLRHQVRDPQGIVWFDLYEKDGEWFVLYRGNTG